MHQKNYAEYILLPQPHPPPPPPPPTPNKGPLANDHAVSSDVAHCCDVAHCGREELHHFLPVLLRGMLSLLSIMTLF